MAFNTETPSLSGAQVLTWLRALPIRFLNNFRAVVRKYQMARMTTTLSQMGDYQLEQIGILRSDIPEYAEKLMSKDDG